MVLAYFLEITYNGEAYLIFEKILLFGLFSNFPGLAFRELPNLSPKTLSIATTAVTLPVLEFSIAISLALIVSSASLVAH